MPRNIEITNMDKQRAWQLFAEITRHRFYFHVLTMPLISDSHYDNIMFELYALHGRTPVPEIIQKIEKPASVNKRDYPLAPEYIREMKNIIYAKINSI